MKSDKELYLMHPSVPLLKFRLLPALLVLAGLCLTCAFIPSARDVFAASAPGTGPINVTGFDGNWIRPDGGYVLEIRDIGNDGRVKAAYYNPRPIKVGRAELRIKNGTAVLVVELRDVNYPGSTYTLRYDPAVDRLQGKYYQAVQKQTYEVELLRYQ
jgi:uncharacterized protein (DUF2147 family)